MSHWDSVRYPEKDKAFFEHGMAEAFTKGDALFKEDGIGAVVFAHKTTEGWEASAFGLVRGGWMITALGRSPPNWQTAFALAILPLLLRVFTSSAAAP